MGVVECETIGSSNGYNNYCNFNGAIGLRCVSLLMHATAALSTWGTDTQYEHCLFAIVYECYYMLSVCFSS